jgi:hypothetical protein
MASSGDASADTGKKARIGPIIARHGPPPTSQLDILAITNCAARSRR